MRKQGVPPSRRNQAVASLLNMPSVGTPPRAGLVRRRDRGRAVVPDGVRRGAPGPGGDEWQQDRTFGPRPGVAPSLLPAELAELEVGPELAEAPVARVAEQPRPERRAGLARPAGQP